MTLKRLMNSLVRVFKEKIFMFIFGVFPISKRRIMFMSYYGKQINCNPYAIYQYIKEKNYPIKYVYVDNHKSDMGKDTKTVKYRSLKFYYYLRTSNVLIFNARPNIDIKKRKKQLYIQTWHSSLGFKKIEKDAESFLPPQYVKKAKIDSSYIDYLISGCAFRSNCFRHNFWYDGEILESGTPRNDILFSGNTDEVRKEVRRELGIEECEKLVLYAPTFRNDSTFNYHTLNYNELVATLELDRSEKWRIACRLHPNCTNDNDLPNGTIDASRYYDMQRLLIASDILITDYSSVMFDFMLLKRPIFLYCPDLKEYLENERELYFSFEELPFNLFKDSKTLINGITSFNFEEYQTHLSRFMQKIGSFEHGNACKNITDIILSFINLKNEID